MLGLGSGGFDVLYANLTRGLGLRGGAGRARDEAARTRRVQAAVRHAEEDGELAEPTSTACPSSAARCTASSRRSARRCAGLRVAYVQLAGGALPVSLSDAVRALQRARAASRSRSPSAPCFGRGRRLRLASRRRSPWAQRRASTSPSARSAPGSSGTASAFGHGGARRGRRGERGDRRSAGGRSSPSASPTPTRASATAASPTTREPCSALPRRLAVAWPASLARRTGCPARGRGRRRLARGLRRASARAHGPRPGRRSVRSSPPPTRPGASRGSCGAERRRRSAPKRPQGTPSP